MPLQKLMQAMQQLSQAKGARPDVMQPEAPVPQEAQPSGLDRLNAVAGSVEDEDAKLNEMADLLSKASGDMANPQAVALLNSMKVEDPEGYARRMKQIMPQMPRTSLSSTEREIAGQGWAPGQE